MLNWKTSTTLAVLVIFLIFFALGEYVFILTHPNQPQSFHPMSDNERSALNMGIVIGIDISRALKGLDSMPPDQAQELRASFDENTNKCQDMRCVMNTIVQLENSIREKVRQQQGELEVLR